MDAETGVGEDTAGAASDISGISVGPRLFAGVFIVYATLAVLLLAMLVPPLQNADEMSHFCRADQVARLTLVGHRFDAGLSAGGMIDGGIVALPGAIDDVRFNPDRKVTQPMLRAAGAVRWGPAVLASFTNTVIYPPFFYLASAAAILAGERAGWSVLHTLIAARILNAMTCVVASAAAIVLAGAASPLLFTVLLLPMTLSLFASVSQDGPMLATAALALAFLLRLAGRAREHPSDWLGLTLCLALLCAARPPYLPVALLPLLLVERAAWRRVASTAAILAVTLAWSMIDAAFTMTNPGIGRGVHPAEQLHDLLVRPGEWPGLAGHALGEGWNIWMSFVGVLGWLDVALPQFAYRIAAGAVVLGLVACCTRRHAILSLRTRGLLLAMLAAAFLGVYLVEYATYTPLHAARIDGVQGRYFIPLALFLPAAMPALGSFPPRLMAAINVCILSAPALLIAVAIRSAVFRYYI